MAFSATLVWEIRVTGNSSNGGAFRGTTLSGTPTAPTVTGAGTGGTVAANTYYVVITYTPGGETRESPISGETSVTLTGSTSKFTVTHPSHPGNGTTWNCYVGTTSGGPYFPQGTSLAIGSDRVITSTPPTIGIQPPGVDYSQQDTAQIAYVDIVIGGTTTTGTSAAHPFTPLMVGNLINVASGTGFTVQWVEITGVTAAGVATFDKSLGTTASTGGTGNMGGAVAHPSTVSPLAVAGNYIFIKYSATPYTFTTSLSPVANTYYWVGYNTTRTTNNTDANRPILRAGANNITFFTPGFNTKLVNLDFDNPSGTFTGVFGVNLGINSYVINCRFQDMNHATFGSILLNGAGAVVEGCEFVRSANCGVYLNSAVVVNRCLFRDGTAAAVKVVSSGCMITNTVVTGTSSYAYKSDGFPSLFLRCVAHSSTGGSGYGFYGGESTYDHCIAFGNDLSGYSGVNAPAPLGRLLNCAGASNGTGNYPPLAYTTDQLVNFVALSGDPFTNAASLDFTINNTSGAGAACRGLAVALAGGTTTSYPDAGAAQHSDGSVASGPTYSSY